MLNKIFILKNIKYAGFARNNKLLYKSNTLKVSDKFLNKNVNVNVNEDFQINQNFSRQNQAKDILDNRMVDEMQEIMKMSEDFEHKETIINKKSIYEDKDNKDFKNKTKSSTKDDEKNEEFKKQQKY